MGHRANFVIVENSKYQIYYSHWGANTIPCDFFWGPEHAIQYIKIQRPVNGWLDNTWAEGGVLVDLDHKVLILFGGEIEITNLPYRIIYLFLLQQVWEDWNIAWANEGIADLADYVGYPRENLIGDHANNLADTLNIAYEGYIESVVSVRFPDDTLLLYPLNDEIECYLNHGPKLLEMLDKTHGYSTLDVKEWSERHRKNADEEVCFPVGGFHIDLTKNTIDAWTANKIPNYKEILQEKWPDWQINWNSSDYKRHLELTNGKLTFPEIDAMEVIEFYLQTFMKGNTHDPVRFAKEMTNQLMAEGKKVEVNPLLYEHQKLEIDERFREKIILNVVKKLTT